jgi:tetratricopeptide (TPR) repeat protein
MDYRIEQLRFQLREDPTSRQFYQLGELLRREGELEAAVAVLRAGLEHHPRYLAAWVALGRTLYELHAYDEAEAAFARALALDPQNAVAAQMVGRSAARRGEWERAVKGLTLALALGPRDDDLEAELEAARAHLTPPRETVAAPPAPDRGMMAPAVPPRPAPVIRSTEITEVFADEPFSMAPRGDTGVFLAAADVFTAAEEEAPDDWEEAAPVAQEPPPLAPAAQPLPDLGVEAPETEAGHGWAAHAEDEGTAEGREEIPLPTVTLARLAVEQGDLDLAERTLDGVLARDPDSAEARELYQDIQGLRDGVAVQPRPSSGAARAAALQAWLRTFRLAAGREEA